MDEDRKLNAEQYALVFGRRLDFDKRVWQIPSLAIAAQAFLLPAAFDATTLRSVALGTAALSIVLSLGAWQLMAKLRQLEIEDAQRLRWFEEQTLGYALLHGKLPEMNCCPRNVFTRIRSYYVWTAILVFLLVAGCIATIRVW